MARGTSAQSAQASAPAARAALSQDAFRAQVRAEGVRLYRDLPWRNTRDPYEIWLSEVMLQQTQVARVEQRWGAWLDRFPSVEALAAAPVADVLAAWQGMGYNRRALALKGAAQQVVDQYGGVFPQDTASLTALPGIGPATAQGIRSFAFNLPGVYLETNVRSVFLHAFFPDAVGVPDRELIPLIAANCPAAPVGADVAAGKVAGREERGSAAAGGAAGRAGIGAVAGNGACAVAASEAAAVGAGADAAGVTGSAADGVAASAGEKPKRHRRGAKEPLPPFATPQDADDTPRAWYYALLDYGAHLKQQLPNPSRRSATHVRQSSFVGSNRQKRAELVRLLLADRDDGAARSTASELTARLSAAEQNAGRPAVAQALAEELLEKLAHEGFCQCEDGLWRIA